MLNDWFGVSRWYYNRTIDYVHQIQGEIKNEKTSHYKTIITSAGKTRIVSELNFQNMRNNMRGTEFDHRPKSKLTFITPVEDEKDKFNIPPWCDSKICPRIIGGAIRDFSKAFDTQRKLVMEGVKSHFTMNYRTKKNDLQSLNLEKTCFGKNNALLQSYFGNLKTSPIVQNKIRMHFKDLTIASDCRLTYDKVKNQFYFNIPIQITTLPENQGHRPVISLDPGIRTFHRDLETYYDLDKRRVRSNTPESKYVYMFEVKL